MLEIKNTYEDRDFIVLARETTTGRDGVPATVGPGQTATIEIDGDHQLVVATGAGRKPEEPALIDVPTATIDGEVTGPAASAAALSAPEPELLPDADDDTVRAEIKGMVDAKQNLTKGGFPELPVLNERLKTLGFAPVNAERRDALMPDPATT